MGKKSSSKTLIPVIVTLVTTAIVFMLPVTFDIGTVGQLWPLIFTALFGSLAFVTFTKEFHGFMATLFFFWFLSNADIVGFGKTWPILFLALAGFVYMGYARSRKGGKDDEDADPTESE